MTLYDAEDAQQVGSDHLIPALDKLNCRDRMGWWLMSHEAKSEMNSYRKMGLPFAQWGQDSNGGLDQVRRYLKIKNKTKPNPFGKKDRFGEPLMGCPMLMLVVDDDQLVRAKDDRGLARHRAEFAGYSWHIPKAGDAPEKLRPQKLFNDAMDGVRCYAEIGFPKIKPLTVDEQVEEELPERFKTESIATLPTQKEKDEAHYGRYFAVHEAKRRQANQSTAHIGPYAAAESKYGPR